MTLPIWTPPKKIIPSETYLGEATKDPLHLAVGRALNEWERAETILAWVFGLLVESRSAAALRAYGTLIAGRARSEALRVAAREFFHDKHDPRADDYSALFNAYDDAAQYRNNIAHGICYSLLSIGGRMPFTSGWFLYPPQYNTRRRSGVGNVDASYIYKAQDIDHCTMRFDQLANEAGELEGYLRATYPVR